MMHKSQFITQCFIAFGLALGCSEQSNLFRSLGDDSSDEALVEQAEEAMDDKDFEEALDIYQALYSEDPGSTAFATGVAAALMGLAGVDTLEIIRKAEEESEGGQDREVYEIIAEALPPIGPANLDLIIEAVDILYFHFEEGRLSCSQELLLALGESVLLIMTVIEQTDFTGDNIIDYADPRNSDMALLFKSLWTWLGWGSGGYMLQEIISDVEGFVQSDCLGDESTFSDKFEEFVFSIDTGECANLTEIADRNGDGLCDGNGRISWFNASDYMIYLKNKHNPAVTPKSCSRKEATDWADSVGCTIPD